MSRDLLLPTSGLTLPESSKWAHRTFILFTNIYGSLQLVVTGEFECTRIHELISTDETDSRVN